MFDFSTFNKFNKTPTSVPTTTSRSRRVSISSSRKSGWFDNKDDYIKKVQCDVIVTVYTYSITDTGLQHHFKIALGRHPKGGTCPQKWVPHRLKTV